MANENVRTLLAANTEHNRKAENRDSENLLIQGDNLEVLKHLVNAYREQVKMIYIDPPYNTGSDGFVYADDRKFTVEELAHLAGIEEDEAQRILEFTQSNSNSHSAWLTFMFPRLYIARELLREDGVIFISIDDNEQAQLKLLCDEVFGEENFVANVIWRKKASPDARSTIGSVHDYLICYVKHSALPKVAVGKMALSDKRKASFSNPDNDPRGLWASVDMTGMIGRATKDQFFKVTLPSGRVIGPPPGRSWGLIERTFKALRDDNRIWFGVDGNNVPRIKRFINEVDGQTVPTYWGYDEVGSNEEASDEIFGLFDIPKLFDTPKPVKLIQRLNEIGSCANRKDIVIDFFSGSGTTAHAVMALNAEDGGNRKCISVQLDEPTDPKSEAHKAGYKTIFEITRERIKRAAAKIREENPEAECDFGFKEFRTIEPFKGYLDEADTLEQYDAFEADKLTGEQRAQLMLTWQVYDGLPLHLDLTPVDLAGYRAHQGETLLYFMGNGLELKHIVALLERIDNDKEFAPRKLIILGPLLQSKAQREISEAVSSYSNRKGIELTLDIRF